MRKTAQGFTLVELLIVIAIIAILAAVVVLIVNPLELTRRGRDAARLSDFANLQQAINIAVQEATNSTQYLLCGGVAGSCAGNSVTGTRSSAGTGWAKVNLGTQTSVSVPTLPIDPINTNTGVGNGNHYIYCSDGSSWEMVTILESVQQNSKMSNDGGSDNAKYEVGSSLALLGTTMPGSVACAY